MNILEALEYIGAIDNRAGQICRMNNGKPELLLFEFGCHNCSEVGTKNADEWGSALETVVGGARQMHDLLARIIATYHRSDEQDGGFSVMEYLIEQAEQLTMTKVEG